MGDHSFSRARSPQLPSPCGCSLYRHSGRLRKAPPRTRKLFLLAQIGAATLLVVSGFYAMLPLLEAVLSCIALLCAIAGLNIFLN